MEFFRVIRLSNLMQILEPFIILVPSIGWLVLVSLDIFPSQGTISIFVIVVTILVVGLLVFSVGLLYRNTSDLIRNHRVKKVTIDEEGEVEIHIRGGRIINANIRTDLKSAFVNAKVFSVVFEGGIMVNTRYLKPSKDLYNALKEHLVFNEVTDMTTSYVYDLENRCWVRPEY